ncbi:MAG: DUF1844 domain-containing protein [Fimbriimonadales bacterium]|nr:DUF1844 domain-containing protein [Fimbriimonadales bacterium]
MSENEKEQQASEEQKGEKPLAPLDVYLLISGSLEQFAALAWQKMGLHPDPLTGEVHRDLPQAKLAIDFVARFIEALEPQANDVERRRLQNLLSDLRINFVKQSQKEPNP